MTLLIHDANVLIDLIGIDLLELALELPFRMATTDLVRREIEDSEQARILTSCIEEGKISVITSTSQEMDTIVSSAEQYSHLSVATEKMEQLMENNPRLPHMECQELLETWQLSLDNKTARRGKSR